MARKERQNVSMITKADATQSSADPFFNVFQEELKTSKGVASGIHAVIREDTGAVLGQYSGEKLLPYRELVETFETALTKENIRFDRSLITTGNGARLYGKYNLETALTIQGESFKGHLNLQGFYDSSGSAGYSYGVKNLVCLNGVEGFTQVFDLFRKVSLQNEKTLIALAHGVAGVIESGQRAIGETIEAMNRIELSNDDARNVISNLVHRGAVAGVSPRTGYLIHHNWANPDEHESNLGMTFNRLYNAATRFTRDVENVGRFEMSRKASRYIGGAFQLATKRDDVLKSLLATPVKPLDFDSVTVHN